MAIEAEEAEGGVSVSRMSQGGKTKLSSGRMLLYAISGFGIGCIDFIVAIYLLKYYTDHVALSATLAGIALMTGKLFDGVRQDSGDPIEQIKVKFVVNHEGQDVILKNPRI